MLEKEIWAALKIDKELGKFVTYDLDARRRWELLMQVLQDSDTTRYNDLKSLTTEIQTVTANRNLIVHGLLSWDRELGIMTFTVFRGKSAGSPKPATKEFVVETRELIQSLAHRIRPDIPIVG